MRSDEPSAAVPQPAAAAIATTAAATSCDTPPQFNLGLPKAGSSALAAFLNGGIRKGATLEAAANARVLGTHAFEMHKLFMAVERAVPPSEIRQLLLANNDAFRSKFGCDAVNVQTILWVFAAEVYTLFPDATFFNIRRNVYTWIDAMLVHLTKSASPDAGDEWQQEALVFLLHRHAELFESIRDGPAARSPPALALVSALAQQWCLHETRYVGPIRSKCRVVGLDSADARLDGFWEPKRTWESSPFNASAKAQMSYANMGNGRSQLWSVPGLLEEVASTVRRVPGCETSANAELLSPEAPPADSRWARRPVLQLETLLRAMVRFVSRCSHCQRSCATGPVCHLLW